jgi:hypothetical protein
MTQESHTKFMTPELEVKHLEHRIKVLCEALTRTANERDTANDKLVEAVQALNTVHTELAIVSEVGFDPDRWPERMAALNKASAVLGKHIEMIKVK